MRENNDKAPGECIKTSYLRAIVISLNV